MLSDFGQMDLSLPASPAFNVLGLSPDKIERPTTLRKLGTSLIRALGNDGKLVKGVALDVNPVLLLAPEWIRAGDAYGSGPDQEDLNMTNYPKRLAARTTLSLASTDADASGASRAAWGIRIGLIDEADPGLFYQGVAKCLRESAQPVAGGRHSGYVDDDKKKANPALDKCLDDEWKHPTLASTKPLWARFSLYAGFGQSWYSRSGSLTDHAPDVKTAWLTTSYGMNSTTIKDGGPDVRVLLQGYLERKINDRTADPNDATKLLRQNSTQAILRLKGGNAIWHLFAEAGGSRVKLANDTTENLKHFALGAEYNLGKMLGMNDSGNESWLQLGYVNERGFSNGKDSTGVTMNFKFGVPFLDLPGAAK